MGPLAGNTSSHQPWARAVDLRTAARAGQTCAITYCCSHHKTTITSKVPTLLSSLGPVREYSCTEFVQSAYLVTPQQLQYENIPAQNSFTRHISSNINIYSHHYLLPPAVGQRSPRSSQSPHYCLNWGQYGNIPAHSISHHTSTLTARENYCTEFIHSAYLVTPQKLKS